MSRVFTPDPDTLANLKVTVTVTKLCVIKLESFCFLICKKFFPNDGKTVIDAAILQVLQWLQAW